MTYSFNLVDEPFIPCLLADGSASELGLKETLLRAPEILEVRDASPLVTISLHRLLLAILHRNFGPTGFQEWKRLWKAGKWNSAKLSNYFRTWHDRFDLFHEGHPFYQTATLETKEPLPVAALFEELASGNNPTLFDHHIDLPPAILSPAQAARGIIARQSFAIGFGRSPVCWIRGRKTEVGYRRDGPLVRGLVLFVRGNNLFETLMCNLTLPETSSSDDLPVWERDDPERVISREQPFGRIDLYTWQCRRVRIEPVDRGAPRNGVRRVHFAQGRGFDKDAVDPMKAYRKDAKVGWVPFSLSEHRALWRDSATLLQLSGDPERPIPALNWMARAVADHLVPAERMYSLDAFGICTEPGKAGSIWLWRNERMPLPLAYFRDMNLVSSLRLALDRAEKTAKKLRGAVWQVARLVLAPDEDKQLGQQQKEDVNRMADSVAPDRLYWSRLEVPFRRLLVMLPGDMEHQQKEVARWVGDVLCREARIAFEQTAGRLDNSARVLRAVVRARERLAEVLAIIAKPYKEVLNEASQ